MKPLLDRIDHEMDLKRCLEAEIGHVDNYPRFTSALEDRLKTLKLFLNETPSLPSNEDALSQSATLLYGYSAMKKVSNRLKPREVTTRNPS